MRREGIIGIFFILLFSFQLLPLQQVGSFLYSNQMTEEIPHSPDESGAKNPDDLKHYYTSFPDHGKNDLANLSRLKGISLDVKVNSRSSDDIQTPPPNFTA